MASWSWILYCAWEAGAASEAEEDLQAEVVAHVKSLVRFPGMADFQYVSCDTRSLQEQVHKLLLHSDSGTMPIGQQKKFDWREMLDTAHRLLSQRVRRG